MNVNRRKIVAVLKKLGFALFILILTGCAAGSSQNVIIPTQPIDGVGATLNVIVTAQDPGDRALVEELERVLIFNLNSRRIFDMARTHLDPSDYVLEVRIIGVKSVDHDSRIAFGGLAGKAKITLRASLFEYGVETALGIVEVEGTSSGGTMFAGTNEDAIQNAVTEILNFLRPPISYP